MTRNRALRAIEDLVHRREQEVIDAAESLYGPQGLSLHAGTREGEDADEALGAAVAALLDARALLAQATEEPTAKAPHSPLRALS